MREERERKRTTVNKHRKLEETITVPFCTVGGKRE